MSHRPYSPPPINVPHDRTGRQPVQAYCRNPECLERSEDKVFRFTVEHNPIQCPKCHANKPPFIGLVALVHYLLRDPAGPIEGLGGLRYRVACHASRAFTATTTNQEAGTGLLAAVTCPGCLEEVERLKAPEVMGLKVNQEQAGELLAAAEMNKE